MPRKTSRPRLLVIGDAVAPTGFTTVTRNLCLHLQSDFEIHQLGINYFGDPHEESWKIYPSLPGGDGHGIGRLESLVETLRPDAVLAVQDLWFLGEYMRRLRDVDPRPKVALYCPIDADPLPFPWVERLEGVDRLVAYTQFGKRVLEHGADEVRRQRPDFRLPPIDVLPHGVDCGTFHPLPARHPRLRRAKALRELSREVPELRDAFVVLNANRNQPRKRIDVTLKAFALFAENKPPHVKLYLHMGVEDAGWHVERLAERLGIRNRLVLSPSQGGMPGFPEARLNTIYNAAAIGLNTAVGEGWGLISFEHAATGAAQIVPRHSALTELWQDAALFVEPAMSLTSPGALCEYKLVSPEAVAEALERLYENPALLDELAAAAYANATRPAYRWPEIARRWSCLLGELLSSPKASEKSRLDLAA